MPGTIYLKEKIIRMDLKLNPNMLFAFGDNILRHGFGGQAAQMRGEPNAVGIPTKWSPGTYPHDYFIDQDLQNAQVRGAINAGFLRLGSHLLEGKSITLPSHGIGTGLAELEFRAPEILKYIENHIRKLYQITES